MTIKASPTLVVLLVTVAIVASIGFFGFLPLIQQISAERASIDVARALKESLALQQKNIDVVTENYATLSAQDLEVEKVFLTEARAVEFFNALDDLSDSTGVQNFQKRLDAPSAQVRQLLGVHLSFSATYLEVLTFLRDVAALEMMIVPNSVTLSQGLTSDTLNVVIDASVPWENGV